MPLKTDYKNFIPSTTTKIHDIKQASDGTVINADVILEDVTIYSQEGDAFGSADINATNAQVNANTDAIALKAPISNVESGWLAILATLTYASADSPTFVVNTSTDLTSKISVGMKLKLTQSTVKYFIVTAITSTTITLYGGTDYTLTSATITDVYFSSAKAPFGFPLNLYKPTQVLIVTRDLTISGSQTITGLNQGKKPYCVEITITNAGAKSFSQGMWHDNGNIQYCRKLYTDGGTVYYGSNSARIIDFNDTSNRAAQATITSVSETEIVLNWSLVGTINHTVDMFIVCHYH